MTRTHRINCAETDCREFGLFEYANRREFAQLPKTFRCARHKAADEVLGAGRMVTRCVLVNQEKDGSRYWNGTSGIVFGPGFRAFAADFPVGARLVVRAEIELIP